jgi:hypothetical protein
MVSKWVKIGAIVALSIFTLFMLALFFAAFIINYAPLLFAIIGVIGGIVGIVKVARIPDCKRDRPVGEVKGIINGQVTQEPVSGTSISKWIFQLDRVDGNGNPIEAVWVFMQGRVTPGPPQSGDIITEVKDPKWKCGENRFKTKSIHVQNSSTDDYWIEVHR